MEKDLGETISTGIVTDTKTGKEYNCEMRIDDELLNLLNDLTEENEQLKQQLKEKDDFIDEVWRKYEDTHGLSIDNTDWF